MKLTVYEPRDESTFWRVSTFGRQQATPGQAYRWDNATRQPTGRVVVQATLAGSIRYRDGRGEQVVRPGDLMLFAYGESSSYGSPAGPLAEPYRCHWVCLDGMGLREHVNVFRERFGSVVSLGTRHPLLAEVEGLIARAETGADTSTTRAAAVHGFVMRLFEQFEQRRMLQLSPVQRAVDFLVREPWRVMSLEAVAREYGCSREHLSRLFREQVGQPAITYVNHAKTQRSLRLLRHTDLPLSEVASQAGFASVKTMRRHVQRATGRTPGGVRE